MFNKTDADNAISDLYRLMKDLENRSGAVEQMARDVAAEGHEETIRFFKKVSDFHDRLSEVKKQYNFIYDMLSKDTIPELMREAGVKTITLEDVGRVTVSYRFSCSILPDQKEVAYEWLRNNDLGDIIVETVNSQTLSATAKNLLENEGKELPPDTFKTGTSPYTSVTAIKATKKSL